MYTEEDLNLAVQQDIFTASSVAEFRALVSSSKNSPAVDEENFRLIGGFNDIFIVIACALLLFSSAWALKGTNESLAVLVFTALSWGLAEFFVRKRKMALPAIFLLVTFIAGTFMFSLTLFHKPDALPLLISSALSVIAAYFHWKRFNVPITIAVGTTAAVSFLLFLALVIFPELKEWLQLILFCCGVITFLFAMYWDSADTTRTTRKSDVAFWLHLLSAPLIIHPVFYNLGILEGNDNISSMVIVIALYLLMTAISIAVDRRAFMVSSLVYVMYALSTVVESFGGVGYSFAVTGIIMGASLLLLSAYWHNARATLLNIMPNSLLQYLPEIKLDKTGKI
jgi:hypothetical protein